MSRDDEPQAPPDSMRPTQNVDGSARRWQLADILGDAREAVIIHAGQEYRLRLTANNKLILTK